jgi:hypothetical protein
MIVIGAGILPTTGRIASVCRGLEMVVKSIIVLSVMATSTIKATLGTLTMARQVRLIYLRGVPLNETGGMVDKFMWLPKTLDATNMWKNITDTRLAVFVSTLSQTYEAEVRREIALLKVLESFNMCLEGSDNIHIHRMLNIPKESTTLLGIVKEEPELCLEMEIKHMGVAKIKNV